MKLIYFLKDDKNDKYAVGIYKKVYGQIKAFQNLGYEPILVFLDNNDLAVYNIKKDEKNIIGTFKNKFQKKYLLYKLLYKYIEQEAIKYIYIRYPMSDYFFVKFLKKCKDSLIKICIEFPTYPYDKEPVNLFVGILIFIDRLFRNQLSKYVDLAVTYTDYQKIYEIDVLYIQNGINLDELKICNTISKHLAINLIGVANVSFWHGYDRVIEGLKNYYQNENIKYDVKFFIVGEGLALNNLKNLTKLHKLEDKVIFCGYKDGKDLDDIFDKSDIAIGGLANHRKNVFTSSSLKNREYCAKALPFIYSSLDKDFENFRYSLKIKDDDSPLNIFQVIDFYENIFKNEDYKQEMRDYAEKYLSWESKMQKVIGKFV